MKKWETTWVWYGDWRTIPLWPFYTFSWFPVVFCDCWPSLPAASCGCYKGLAGWRCPSAYWPASGSDTAPVKVYSTSQSYSTGTDNYNQLILYKGKYRPFIYFHPFCRYHQCENFTWNNFFYFFGYCDQVIKLVDPASESIQFIIHFYQSFFSPECHITETKPWAWKKSGWNTLIIVCRCKRAKIKWEKITLYTWVSLLQKMVKRLKKKLFTGFYCSI